MKILLAVDGSAYTVKAGEYIATHLRECPGKLELHVPHVHLPIPRGLALVQAERLFSADVDDDYYKSESEAVLEPRKPSCASTIFRSNQTTAWARSPKRSSAMQPQTTWT